MIFDIETVLDYYGIYYEEAHGSDDIKYLCPFHDDDHLGSALFNSVTGVYNCFACHEGGYVIKFVSEMSNITYEQASALVNSNFEEGAVYDVDRLTRSLERSKRRMSRSRQGPAMREISYKILKELSVKGISKDLIVRWYSILPAIHHYSSQVDTKYKLVEVVDSYDKFVEELNKELPHE